MDWATRRVLSWRLSNTWQMDNIFIERLWRSLKYQAVYLNESSDRFVAERIIGNWFNFSNTQRPHSSFDGRTPQEIYDGAGLVDMMDKPAGLPTCPQAKQKQGLNKGILAA